LQNELVSRDDFNEQLSRAEKEIRELMEKRKVECRGDKEDAPVVTVGCRCGSGHHRSVAFAEELRKIEWPEGWQIEVAHHNLTPEVKRFKKEIRDKVREEKRVRKETSSGPGM
jgi:RNase adaptor protein for sRNA GlmZ degradation